MLSRKESAHFGGGVRMDVVVLTLLLLLQPPVWEGGLKRSKLKLRVVVRSGFSVWV